MRDIMGKRRIQEAYKPSVLLTAPLQSGANIPLLGLGTWKAKPGEVRAAVLYAITHAGYRHIDCAAIYENEGEVGSALEEVFSNWDVKRDDIFITTKLWNNDHAAARVEPALRKCLKLLKVDYVDAFLIHWPITGKAPPGPAPVRRPRALTCRMRLPR
jgi:alcohol dehydrogenase (NADP+)